MPRNLSKAAAIKFAKASGMPQGRTLLIQADGTVYPRNTLAGNKPAGGWGVTHTYQGEWKAKKLPKE